MGAYAVPSNKSFVTSGKVNMKRKRGRIDELREFFKDTELKLDKDANTILVFKNGEIIGEFKNEKLK